MVTALTLMQEKHAKANDVENEEMFELSPI